MTIRLNLGCSLEAMRTMEDNTYDLAVVDPPYGKKPVRDTDTLGICKSNFQAGCDSWDIKPNQEYFDELFRVSKNQIIWGANYFIEHLYSSNSFIIWDKMKVGEIFADCEMAWTSFNSTAKIFQFQWHGMLQGNMKEREKKIHPTQKPVALYSWIFDKYSEPGMKILDTNLGSGSIAIAAHNHGLDLDGWEIDPDYYAAAVHRFEKHTRQLKLF